MFNKNTIIHITDYPAYSGSTNELLGGFITSENYQQNIHRDIIISPLPQSAKLKGYRIDDDCKVLYCSGENLHNHPYSKDFSAIENKFGVSIIYGHRQLSAELPCPQNKDKNHIEFVLVDVKKALASPVNALKSWLYEEFGIESHRYEDDIDYDTYTKLAPAALAIARAMDCCHGDNPAIMVAHNYAGMPTVLAARLDPLACFKTVLWAHEVPTIAEIIEKYPGHDTMFINIMRWAQENDYFVSDIFGNQDYSYRHRLYCASRFCDNIIASSQRVAEHLRLLEPQMKYLEIDIVPDGLSGRLITLHQKLQSRLQIQEFAKNLLGYIPDFIFTHNANIETSKAIWRDLRVLYYLEKIFADNHQTAVFFILGTENCDANFRQCIQQFNDRNAKIKILYINTNNYNSETLDCQEIKIASDLEFGQSIYEPFGRAQLEALSMGSLCVATNICGCMELLSQLFQGQLPENLIVADYTNLENSVSGRSSLLKLNQSQRDSLEEIVAGYLAHEIWEKLPRDKQQRQLLLDNGHIIASNACWNNIAQEHLLKSLNNTLGKTRKQQIFI